MPAFFAKSSKWYSAMIAPFIMDAPADTPANGQPTIGRPFYGQAKGQLRLTCAFYAECAHEGSGAFGARVQRVQKEKVLKIDGAFGPEGCGLPLCGNAYKVSVTDLPFCVIWYDKHFADRLAALASPLPASPDFPRSSVGQSKGKPFYGQA